MKTAYLPAFPLILVVTLLVSACKKESNITGPVIVSFVETGLQEEFILLSADTTIHNVKVKMEGDAWVVPNSIVSLTVDPSLLSVYNTASGNHFELLPDSVYSLAKASAVVLTGFGQLQLPVEFSTKKINPYIKYVLPLKLQAADLEVDPSANTILVRVLLSNNYTGVYADTITSAALAPTFPFNPNWNFTDSIVNKNLTAINDSTVLMDLALPGMFNADQSLIVHIRPGNNIRLEVYDDSPSGALLFGMVNAGLQPYYSPSTKYFYIPYNYYSLDFNIRERLKRL